MDTLLYPKDYAAFRQGRGHLLPFLEKLHACVVYVLESHAWCSCMSTIIGVPVTSGELEQPGTRSAFQQTVVKVTGEHGRCADGGGAHRHIGSNDTSSRADNQKRITVQSAETAVSTDLCAGICIRRPRSWGRAHGRHFLFRWEVAVGTL